METQISQRKRDLLTVFSEQELEGLAQRRGDIRKAAKKKKKRLQRSEAGLVDIWNKGLDLPKDNDDSITAAPQQQFTSRGLFDVLLPSQGCQEDVDKQREEEEEEL